MFNQRGRNRSFVPFFSVLATTVFFFHVVSAPFVEASTFWAERRQSLRHRQREVGPPSLLSSLVNPSVFPSVDRSAFSPSRSSLPLGKCSDLATLFARDGFSVQAVSSWPRPSSRTVVILQDVHLNENAQKALSGVLEKLGGTVDFVGLEGAWAPVDLGLFRVFPERNAVRLAADSLLRAGRVTGPVHGAMVSAGPIPFLTGVDDAILYRSNVDAYLRSSGKMASARTALEEIHRKLVLEKDEVFNPSLAVFDGVMESRRQGKTSLGTYAETLFEGNSPKDFPQSSQFLKVWGMEKTVDFHEAEKERKNFIEMLSPVLRPEDLTEMARWSVDHRWLGGGSARFYDRLRALAKSRGVSLPCPALDAYLRYVRAAESIVPDALDREFTLLEAEGYRRRIISPSEKTLIERDRRLSLLSRLADFSLTPGEWRSLRDDPLVLESVPEDLRSDLADFQVFYERAEARDRAMADNLIRQMDRRGASVSALVAGGFHSPGVTQRLEQQGISVMTVTPPVGAVEDSSGAQSLDVFRRPQTPLEKRFAGERLFLGIQPAGEGRSLPVLAASLVAGASALMQPESLSAAPAIVERLGNTPAEISLSAGTAEVSLPAAGVQVAVTLREETLAFEERPLTGFRVSLMRFLRHTVETLRSKGPLGPLAFPLFGKGGAGGFSLNRIVVLLFILLVGIVHPSDPFLWAFGLLLFTSETASVPEDQPDIEYPATGGYKLGEFIKVMEILRGQGKSEEDYRSEGFLAGKMEEHRDAVSRAGDTYSLTHLQAVDPAQSMREAINNSRDAIKKNSGIVDWIGQFGLGGKQMDMEKPSHRRVIQTSKKDDGRLVEVWLWEVGRDTYFNYRIKEKPKGFSGTHVRVIRPFSPEELTRRETLLRRWYKLNTEGPVLFNGELLNKPEDYLYRGDGPTPSLEEADPVTVTLTEDGWSVQDPGVGMGLKEVFENYLFPNGSDKPIPSSTVEEMRRESGFFYRPGSSGVEAPIASLRIKGNEIEPHRLPSDRLNMAPELHLCLPRAATGELSQERTSLSLMPTGQGTTASLVGLQQIIDRLTSPEWISEDRFALVNTLAALIEVKQRPADIEKVKGEHTERMNLRLYLRGKLAPLLEAERQKGRSFFPNTRDWEAMSKKETVVPLDPGLFDVTDQDFQNAGFEQSTDARFQPLASAGATVWTGEFPGEPSQSPVILLPEVPTPSGSRGSRKNEGIAVLDRRLFGAEGGPSVRTAEMLISRVAERLREVQKAVAEIKTKDPQRKRSPVTRFWKKAVVILLLIVTLGTFLWAHWNWTVPPVQSPPVGDPPVSGIAVHVLPDDAMKQSFMSQNKASLSEGKTEPTDKYGSVTSPLDHLVIGVYGLSPDDGSWQPISFHRKTPIQDTVSSQVTVTVPSQGSFNLPFRLDGYISEVHVVPGKPVPIHFDGDRRVTLEAKEYGSAEISYTIRFANQTLLGNAKAVGDLDISPPVLSQQERRDFPKQWKKIIDPIKKKPKEKRDELVRQAVHEILAQDAEYNKKVPFKKIGNTWGQAFSHYLDQGKRIPANCDIGTLISTIIYGYADIPVAFVSMVIPYEGGLYADSIGHAQVLLRYKNKWILEETTDFMPEVYAASPFGQSRRPTFITSPNVPAGSGGAAGFVEKADAQTGDGVSSGGSVLPGGPTVSGGGVDLPRDFIHLSWVEENFFIPLFAVCLFGLGYNLWYLWKFHGRFLLPKIRYLSSFRRLPPVTKRNLRRALFVGKSLKDIEKSTPIFFSWGYVLTDDRDRLYAERWDGRVLDLSQDSVYLSQGEDEVFLKMSGLFAFIQNGELTVVRGLSLKGKPEIHPKKNAVFLVMNGEVVRVDRGTLRVDKFTDRNAGGALVGAGFLDTERGEIVVGEFRKGDKICLRKWDPSGRLWGETGIDLDEGQGWYVLWNRGTLTIVTGGTACARDMRGGIQHLTVSSWRLVPNDSFETEKGIYVRGVNSGEDDTLFFAPNGQAPYSCIPNLNDAENCFRRAGDGLFFRVHDGQTTYLDTNEQSVAEGRTINGYFNRWPAVLHDGRVYRLLKKINQNNFLLLEEALGRPPRKWPVPWVDLTDRPLSERLSDLTGVPADVFLPIQRNNPDFYRLLHERKPPKVWSGFSDITNFVIKRYSNRLLKLDESAQLNLSKRFFIAEYIRLFDLFMEPGYPMEQADRMDAFVEKNLHRQDWLRTVFKLYSALRKMNPELRDKFDFRYRDLLYFHLRNFFESVPDLAEEMVGVLLTPRPWVEGGPREELIRWVVYSKDERPAPLPLKERIYLDLLTDGIHSMVPFGQDRGPSGEPSAELIGPVSLGKVVKVVRDIKEAGVNRDGVAVIRDEVIGFTGSEPDSSGLIGPINSQPRNDRAGASRELIQNGVDVVLGTDDVPRRVDVRSYYDKAKGRWVVSVKNPGGVSLFGLFNNIFGRKTTKTLKEEILGYVKTSPTADQLADKLWSRVVRGALRSDPNLEERFRAFLADYVTQHPPLSPGGAVVQDPHLLVDTLLIEFQDSLSPSNAGQFGLGGAQAIGNSDRVLARTGTGGKVVEAELVPDRQGDQITAANFSFVRQYDDPDGVFDGTEIQMIMDVTEDNYGWMVEQYVRLKMESLRQFGAVEGADLYWNEELFRDDVDYGEPVVSDGNALRSGFSKNGLSRVTGRHGVTLSDIPREMVGLLPEKVFRDLVRHGWNLNSTAFQPIRSRVGIYNPQKHEADVVFLALRDWWSLYRSGRTGVPGLLPWADLERRSPWNDLSCDPKILADAQTLTERGREALTGDSLERFRRDYSGDLDRWVQLTLALFDYRLPAYRHALSDPALLAKLEESRGTLSIPPLRNRPGEPGFVSEVKKTHEDAVGVAEKMTVAGVSLEGTPVAAVLNRVGVRIPSAPRRVVVDENFIHAVQHFVSNGNVEGLIVALERMFALSGLQLPISILRSPDLFEGLTRETWTEETLAGLSLPATVVLRPAMTLDITYRLGLRLLSWVGVAHPTPRQVERFISWWLESPLTVVPVLFPLMHNNRDPRTGRFSWPLFLGRLWRQAVLWAVSAVPFLLFQTGFESGVAWILAVLFNMIAHGTLLALLPDLPVEDRWGDDEPERLAAALAGNKREEVLRLILRPVAPVLGALDARGQKTVVERLAEVNRLGERLVGQEPVGTTDGDGASVVRLWGLVFGRGEVAPDSAMARLHILDASEDPEEVALAILKDITRQEQAGKTPTVFGLIPATQSQRLVLQSQLRGRAVAITGGETLRSGFEEIQALWGDQWTIFVSAGPNAPALPGFASAVSDHCEQNPGRLADALKAILFSPLSRLSEALRGLEILLSMA